MGFSIDPDQAIYQLGQGLQLPKHLSGNNLLVTPRVTMKFPGSGGCKVRIREHAHTLGLRAHVTTTGAYTGLTKTGASRASAQFTAIPADGRDCRTWR